MAWRTAKYYNRVNGVVIGFYKLEYEPPVSNWTTFKSDDDDEDPNAPAGGLVA